VPSSLLPKQQSMEHVFGLCRGYSVSRIPKLLSPEGAVVVVTKNRENMRRQDVADICERFLSA
jgi:hypothetical protein